MTRRAAPLLLLGIAIGTFSAIGDAVSFLAAPANAVGPWVVAAFAAGAIAGRPRAGAVGGMFVLLVAVVAYYVGVRVLWGDAIPDPVRAAAAWAAVAVPVGATLGAAGGTWRTGPERWRVPAVALLSGVLLAEAVARFVEVEGWTGIALGRTALQVCVLDTIAAVAAIVLLLDRERWAGAFAMSAAIGAVGAAAIGVAVDVVRRIAVGG